MEMPQIRPGAVKNPESRLRVVAFFHNAAEGNLAIQQLTAIGIPNDRLGVTPPEQIEGGQGMILSIGCPDEKSLAGPKRSAASSAAGSIGSGCERTGVGTGQIGTVGRRAADGGRRLGNPRGDSSLEWSTATA